MNLLADGQGDLECNAGPCQVWKRIGVARKTWVNQHVGLGKLVSHFMMIGDDQFQAELPRGPQRITKGICSNFAKSLKKN